MVDIPLLSANDVELRVAQLKETNYGVYVTLLCYKDARCDMRVLDAIYGSMNWQRSHELINGNLFCTVEVWDCAKEQWIKKQDVGTESNTEAVKGQASDAFKRACFCLGIGRELYAAPDIHFKLNENEVSNANYGKPKCYAKFHVGEMEYDKNLGRFTAFTVLDEEGNIRFDISKTCQNKTGPNISQQEIQPDIQQEPGYNQQIDTFRTSNTKTCCQCNAEIKSPKVAEFALKRFGRMLCYNCQKKQSM